MVQAPKGGEATDAAVARIRAFYDALLSVMKQGDKLGIRGRYQLLRRAVQRGGHRLQRRGWIAPLQKTHARQEVPLPLPLGRQGQDRDVEPGLPAGLGPRPHVEGLDRLTAAHQRHDPASFIAEPVAVPVPAREDIAARSSDHVTEAVTEDLLGSVVPRHDPTVVVDREGPIADTVKRLVDVIRSHRVPFLGGAGFPRASVYSGLQGMYRTAVGS